MIDNVSGRVLGEPIWWQSPGGGDGFLVRFDAGFCPMNLGDRGVMYVFDDTRSGSATEERGVHVGTPGTRRASAMTRRQIGPGDETCAYLVAGRAFSGVFTAGEFDHLRQRIAELAAEIDRPLVVLQPGDPLIALPSGNTATGVVGLLLASADSFEFTAIGYEELTSGLAAAVELPWALITERAFEERVALSDTALYATSRGPLAGLFVAYGVLVELREPQTDPDWEVDEEDQFRKEENGIAALVPGLDLVRGNMMDQLPQVDAVYGVQVANAFYHDRPPVRVDISEQAHARRVARLADLADRATYYVVAHYD